MTGRDATLEDIMGPTAVVRLDGDRPELFRHPEDGRVVAFDDATDAFAFAVSLELASRSSAGCVNCPDGETVHILAPGVTASDLMRPIEEAA
jgi:hypothetical protein